MGSYLGKVEDTVVKEAVSAALPYVIGIVLLTIGITLLLVWLIWFNKKNRRDCSSRRRSCKKLKC